MNGDDLKNADVWGGYVVHMDDDGEGNRLDEMDDPWMGIEEPPGGLHMVQIPDAYKYY